MVADLVGLCVVQELMKIFYPNGTFDGPFCCLR